MSCLIAKYTFAGTLHGESNIFDLDFPGTCKCEIKKLDGEYYVDR